MANASNNDILNNEDCLKLGKLIETLTHSGLRTLDEEIFKEIKKICKSSPGYVEKAYTSILHQLKKKHAEIRYSAFQMCIELFNKSHVFREAIIKDLQLVFELVAETNPKKLLPPPKSVAESLKKLALSTMQKWIEQFGRDYKELHIAYQYLKHCKRVDFAALEMHNSAEHARRVEQERRMAVVNEEKMKKLKEDIQSNEEEIETTLTTLKNCITLLLPSPENFFIADEKEDAPKSPQPSTSSFAGDAEDDESVNLRQHGMNPKLNLTLNLDIDQKIQVKKTEENSSVIDNANDCIRLINNRFMPMVKKWVQICTKHSESNTNNTDFKKIMSIKENLEKYTNKYKELNIEGGEDDDTSDDDFEEVTKEGYEETVEEIEEDLPVIKNATTNVRKSHTEWKISLGEDERDPASALNTLKQLHKKETSSKSLPSTSKAPEPRPSTSKSIENEKLERKKKLLKTAPKLPFDIDLYHWEDENLSAPTLFNVKLDNPRFWGTTTVDEMDEIPNPEGIAALRTRVIEFSGTFEPVKWSCRSPLPNGKLCPRKDRFKCPFHGEIVARDETGKCINEEDEKRLKKIQKEKEEEQPEWQDPQLLADLEAATGINLKMPEKRGKKRKSKTGKKMSKTNKKMKTSASTVKEIERHKFPGLTDIVSKQNNAYKRLSKKIFNKSALKRVASAIDKAESKKFRDKFGDQFNYVYNTA